MTLPTKLRARVSPEAITKVTRIFNGTLDDVFNELFQNARRAGATTVAVTAEHLEEGCQITVTDDGLGIADPEALVSLGQSDWSDTCRACEDPAGMGFFSLAGLDTVVRSVSATSAFSLAIAGDAWTGEADIDVAGWDGPRGTSVAFCFAPPRDGKLQRCVEAAARHFPLPVTLNGEVLKHVDFLGGAHAIIEREGYRLGVFRNRYSNHGDTVNFHGVTLRHVFSQVKEIHHAQWSVHVDVVDAPELVLVLPARKEIYHNAGLRRLEMLCREAMYETIIAEPFHRLSHASWLEANLFFDAVPEAIAQLPPWCPSLARDSYRDVPDFTAIETNAALYDNTDCLDSVNFGRALAFSRNGRDGDVHRLDGPAPLTFYEPIKPFIGYSWYDRLACYVRTGERLSDDNGNEAPCGPDPCTWRPDTITLELSDQFGRGLDLRTDFALLESDDAWSDADTVQIALTRNARIEVGDLIDLITDGVFSPSGDSDADSYDTQETRFRYDATARAHAILENDDAATLAVIRMVFADRIAWRIPAGRTLHLTWSMDRKALVLLPEPDVQTPTTGATGAPLT
ncbi:ATP-binding protein [Novosphingobium sp. 17-62-19]|uniref:ATP-binding protein n=1 Tax=Novosphingobium sp. 17-62-19 TaxID=1970406 RepID=UPI0025E2A3AE|nr:ATP-binding protein [Novosphingobium sp. 17-62-19]